MPTLSVQNGQGDELTATNGQEVVVVAHPTSWASTPSQYGPRASSTLREFHPKPSLFPSTRSGQGAALLATQARSMSTTDCLPTSHVAATTM